MPIYLFENVETGELREIFFHMTDKKIYNGEDSSQIGIWERRYYSPQVAIDVNIDEMDSKRFVETSSKKKGTLGNLFDASKEASLKRERIMGKDFVKESSLQKWKERRRRKDGSLPKHSSEVARSISIVAE